MTPLTSTATAADPEGSVEVVLAELSGGGASSSFHYAEQFEPPAGPRTVFGATVETGQTSVITVSTSARGDLVASVEDSVNRQRVRVRDLEGALIREIDVAPDSRVGSKVMLERAVLSPSGARVAWSRFDYEDSDFREGRTALVAGGPQHVLGRNIVPLAFLREDLLLVNDIGGSGRQTLSLSTGQTQPVIGEPVPVEDTALCASFDAAVTHVACVTRANDGTTTVEVAPVSLSGDTLVIGPRTLLDSSPDGGPAVFSRDGASVYYVRGGDLWSVPSSGGGPTPLGLPTPSRETGLAVGVRDGLAPAAPVSVGPATLAATTATIPYALAPDPTGSRVRFTRTSPGLPTVTREATVRSPIIDTGLVVGRTYTYAVQALDRSGNVGDARSFSLVATAPPALAVPDPTSAGSATSSSFPLVIAPAGNAAGTRYSIDGRDAGASAWTRRTTLQTAPTLTFTGTTAGRTYVLRGQAVDVFGNATAPVVSQRAVVPFDQQRAALAGSTVTVARTGAYGGTSVFLRAAGATATTRLVGDRFQVVGESGPTTGAFDVFLDGVSQARVDSRSATMTPRKRLWSKAFDTNRNQALTVRAVGTAGRPTVVLDAFSSRRYEQTPAALRSGQQLIRGQHIASANGHRAVLQPRDGNLVVYSPTGRGLFATRVAASRVVVGTDGNLVAYDSAGAGVFQTHAGGNGASTLIMQNDGNLVLYRDRDGRPTWSSRSGRTY